MPLAELCGCPLRPWVLAGGKHYCSSLEPNICLLFLVDQRARLGDAALHEFRFDLELL